MAAIFCAIIAITTTLFGWNLAELNAPEIAIRKDLELNSAQVGLASSIFAIGGLIGAFLSGPAVSGLGRRNTLILVAFIYLIAGIMKASAQEIVLLASGRFISGLAAGCGVVIAPLIIIELAPPASKGKLWVTGAMTQVSINVGILSTQVLGIFFGKPSLWRIVLLVGGILGAVQAFLLAFVPESPAFLFLNGKKEEARKALVKLRGTIDIDDEFASFQSSSTQGDEDEPLLPEATRTVGIIEFATAKKFRWPLMVVVGVMLAQQFTGINAVVMYGVSILQNLLPAYATVLNAGISAINLIITLSASMVFDKIEHKTLLLLSMSGMSFFAIILGVGIHLEVPLMSAIGTLFFVSSFSFGLGPLPWMVASRTVDKSTVGSAQSLAMVANWLGTFVVGFGVPVLATTYGMDILFFGFSVAGVLFFLWGFFVLPS